ncbi:universal stress protein [Pseudonocardia saturnea]
MDVVSAYLPPLEPVAAGDAQPIASPVDLRNAVLTSARRIVDEVVAEAAPTTGPVPVDVDAVAGEAAHALIVRSRGAVMLVIGHHGRGGLEELPVGSVARRCVRDATCPVLVVPVGDGADLGPG